MTAIAVGSQKKKEIKQKLKYTPKTLKQDKKLQQQHNTLGCGIVKYEENKCACLSRTEGRTVEQWWKTKSLKTSAVKGATEILITIMTFGSQRHTQPINTLVNK